MKLEELRTLEDVQAFLEGAQAVVFEVAATKAVRYRWIERILIRFSYSKLSKKQRGWVIRLLMKVSGYSRQQVTRLVQRYRQIPHARHSHWQIRAESRSADRTFIDYFVDWDRRLSEDRLMINLPKNESSSRGGMLLSESVPSAVGREFCSMPVS